MADNTSKETVVFEIDVSSYEKSLANLTKSINDLKASQKDLQQQTKDGVKGAAEAYERVTAELKVQQQQYRTTQAALVGYTATQQKGVDTSNFFNNSIQTNRDLLKQLTAEYIRTKNPSEQFTQKIKSVSDALKQQEAAIGDTRRNVGNYTEAFKTALSGLSGFGGQVVAVGQNLGGAVNAFKAAEGGVKGFGAALATTGLPLIIMGVNALTEAFSKFKPVADAVEEATTAVAAAFNALISGGNISEAVNQSLELLEVMRDLEDTQRAFNIQSERYNNEIQRLIVVSKDRTKTEQQRLAALNAANELEGKLFAENTKRLDDELAKRKEVFISKTRLTEQEFKLLTQGTNQQALELRARVEKNKQYSEEELNVIQDLIRERVRVEGESLILQERLINRTNQLQQELTKVKKAETQARINIGIAETQAFENAIKKQQEEVDKAEQTREERELAAIVKRENIIAERIGTEQALIDAEILNRNFILETTQLTETERQNIILDSENKIAEIRKRFRDTNNQLAKQEAEVNTNQILSFVNSAISQIGSLISESTSQRLEELDSQVEAGIITQEEFNKRSKELKKQAFEETKAVNIVNAIISTAQAVLNAYNSGLQAGGPAGPAVGAVFAGIAAAIGAAQIGIISSQQPPKFAEGGDVFDVGGKPHSQGGTIYTGADGNMFEVERGEKIFVLKKSASDHINMLGGLNMAFGGNSWNGSPTKYAAEGGQISTGGFVTRDINNNAEQAAIMRASIIEGFRNAPQPVVAVKEINTVNKGLQRSVAVSEL